MDYEAYEADLGFDPDRMPPPPQLDLDNPDRITGLLFAAADAALTYGVDVLMAETDEQRAALNVGARWSNDALLAEMVASMN